MEDKVPMIMESVFECTLEMINKDYHEYPDHRVQFFKLLQAINLYCFPALLKLQPAQFKIVIDSCMWASKHVNREVENTGLTMCLELINNMAETDVQTSNAFFQRFFIQILGDVFFVLSDSNHKAGTHTSLRPSRNHTHPLCLRFQVSSYALVAYVLLHRVRQSAAAYLLSWPNAHGNNQQRFLAEVFGGNSTQCIQKPSRVCTPRLPLSPNLCTDYWVRIPAKQFVAGLFTYNDDFNKFKTHLRDFLISLKENPGDNAELYADEREQEARDAKAAERDRALKVGGLLKPSEMDQDEEI